MFFKNFILQVQHALKKSEMALQTLDKAISIDPNNPLCKFHRASILFANDKHRVSIVHSLYILFGYVFTHACMWEKKDLSQMFIK